MTGLSGLIQSEAFAKGRHYLPVLEAALLTSVGVSELLSAAKTKFTADLATVQRLPAVR